MKRAGLFLILMIVLTFALLHQSRGWAQRQRAQIPPDRTAQRAELSPEQAVSTQQRVNRYFHDDIVPKLKECWRGVQGKGNVEFDYSFTRTGTGRWTFDRVTTGGTSLPAAESAKALRCMETAVRGSSFASTADDKDQRDFELHWSWPVPFPARAEALKNAMFAFRVKNGGTTKPVDCDGRGTAPKCYLCDKGTCKKVCVGYKTCSMIYQEEGNNCQVNSICASGGPWSVTGGSRVIF